MAKTFNIDSLLGKWNKEIRENSSNRAYHRYMSFDYCYGYFYKHHKNSEYFVLKDNIEKSCLHLGFYLASWGMYRGSTELLKTSFKIYEPLIKQVIAKQKAHAWAIDVNNYEENKKILVQLYNSISKVLKKSLKEDPTETLVTKILLGVFGCVPAFDTNVKKGLRKAGESHHKNFEKNIEAVEEVYKSYKKEIDKTSKEYKVLDFETGKPGKMHYTKAKIIDMILFEYGKKDK